jgi:uncharacterized protein (DUF1697 family)
MSQHVAFLRAINVGGHVVKMDHLRQLFEDMGLANVRTFIASGNVIFDSATKNPQALEEKISRALEKALGYKVGVFIRSAAEIAAIATHNPYKDTELQEGSLFIGLLPAPLSTSEQKIVAAMQTSVDALRVKGRELYWHAGKNFRDAEFSPAKLEKSLGKPATFRNVTTIRKIAALVGIKAKSDKSGNRNRDK